MTAYRQMLTNSDGEPLGYEYIYPDEPMDYDDYWEGGMDENDPADDPNHSHYTDMDFDVNAEGIEGNVNKDCSFCGEAVCGPWDETYYDGGFDFPAWASDFTNAPDMNNPENVGFGFY